MINDDNESDESEETDSENELAMITRKFSRYIKRKGYRFKKKCKNKGEASKEKEKKQYMRQKASE